MTATGAECGGGGANTNANVKHARGAERKRVTKGSRARAEGDMNSTA